MYWKSIDTYDSLKTKWIFESKTPVISFLGWGMRQPRPHHLNFLWAPYKLVFTVIVEIGKLDETPALPHVEDGKNKVVENTVLDIWEFSFDESLLQEEVDQGGLVVRVPQGSQAFEDAGDAQVVMSVAVNDKQ